MKYHLGQWVKRKCGCGAWIYGTITRCRVVASDPFVVYEVDWIGADIQDGYSGNELEPVIIGGTD
jgi:hypothetical protein